jgi:hypothetical protein
VKYKTIIEIIAEANDSHDALDIAGEYLRGSISSGVSMRYKSVPINPRRKIFISVACILLSASVVLGTFLFISSPSGTHISSNPFPSKKIGSAVQPPLRTNGKSGLRDQFKDKWSDKSKQAVFQNIPSAK